MPSKSLRILWICGSDIIGGAERVSLQILTVMRKRGHAVGAVLRAGSPTWLGAADFAVNLYSAGFAGPLDFPSIAALVRADKDFKSDILMATTPNEWVWACLLPRRRARLVLVRQMSLRLAPAVRWLANRRADAVIAPSEAARVSLIGPPGVSANRISVIPNPVRFRVRDSVPSSEARAQLRKLMGLDEAGKWIGFFGGDDPKKGIADLMEAAAQLRNDNIDIRLFIGGRMKLPGSIAAMSAGYNLKVTVQTLPDVELERAITAMDAIAIPTHRSLGEGLPLVALESMACATPLAGYAIPGIADAIGGEVEAGLLATPDTPADLARVLKTILTDTQTAARLAGQGLIRARTRFAPSLAADRYERLFLELVSAPEKVARPRDG